MPRCTPSLFLTPVHLVRSDLAALGLLCRGFGILRRSAAMAVYGLCVAFALLLGAHAVPLSAAELQFSPQVIASGVGVVYAVTTADVNRDGKLDVVALTPTQVLWFENPSWQRHVVLDGITKKDNVCIAPYDIDRDGQIDFAIGADWQPTNTAAGGTLQWITRQGAPNPAPGQNANWAHFPLTEEPTLHRIRFGDVDGDGQQELIVAPLHGRGNQRRPDWEGDGVRLLVFRIPANPAKDPWPMEVADTSLHILHNITLTDFDGDGSQEILAAAREGLFVLDRDSAGKWSRRQLGEGSPGEVKIGQLNGRQRAVATVEPWHGNGVVIYEEPPAPLTPQAEVPKRGPRAWDGSLWPRQFIEERLAQAHALAWGDFDGNGADELAVGWREKEFGVALYSRNRQGQWSRTKLVEPASGTPDGMATEDMVSADLDGDGLPELIAGGRKTANVKIYWNRTKPDWVRHVVASGDVVMSAIAGDFTNDGRPDLIGVLPQKQQFVLYPAPDFKPRVLLDNVNGIHSEMMDVDGDGDLDYIGTRYSPGLIFWLEQPAQPLTAPWPYHEIDDSAKGGVDGIHGLLLGDIDRDGRPDLIGNSGQPKGAFPNSLAWFKAPKNPRTAKNWSRTIFADGDAPGLSHYLAFGDLNGDGRPDLASAAKLGPEGNWFAWWEQPKQATQRGWRRHVLATGQEGATNLVIADFDGDRQNDVFATRGHGVGALLFRAPAFTPQAVDDTLVGPHNLAAGDIDGDGDLDTVTCGKDSFEVVWFENLGPNAAGNTQKPFRLQPIHSDQSAYDIRLFDMDKDGDLDVVVAGWQSKNLTWYENRLPRKPAK